MVDLVTMEMLLWEQRSDGTKYDRLPLVCSNEKDEFVSKNSALPVGNDFLVNIHCSRIALVEQVRSDGLFACRNSLHFCLADSNV